MDLLDRLDPSDRLEHLDRPEPLAVWVPWVAWDPQVCRVFKESRATRVIRALVVPEVFREFPDQLDLQLE